MTNDMPHQGYDITLHLPDADIEVPGMVHPAAIPREGEVVQLAEPNGLEAGDWVVTCVFWNIRVGHGLSRNVSLTLAPAECST